jgi:hypothetical protein
MGKVEIDRGAILAAPPPAGPFVMVNMFRLKDPSKLGEWLSAMQNAAHQEVEKLGADGVYAGTISAEFVGEGHWHLMILARYPSWTDFCSTLASEAMIEKMNAVRRTYLEDSSFMLSCPLGA